MSICNMINLDVKPKVESEFSRFFWMDWKKYNEVHLWLWNVFSTNIVLKLQIIHFFGKSHGRWQRSYRPTSGQLCLFGSLNACAHPFRRCPFVAGWLMLRWAFLGPLDIELLLMIGVMVEWPVSRSLKKEAAEEAAVERTLVFNRVGCKSWLESLGTQFTFSS